MADLEDINEAAIKRCAERVRELRGLGFHDGAIWASLYQDGYRAHEGAIRAELGESA